MTLISFEGPSKSGKTTIYNRIVDEKDYVEIKGPRLVNVGLADWLDYQKWEHAIKKPIFDANPDVCFIANRAFSEAVYGANQAVREHMMRLYGGYDDAMIVYVTATNDVLIDRGTHDAWRLDDILVRYQRLLGSMHNLVIDTTDRSIDDCVDEVSNWLP